MALLELRLYEAMFLVETNIASDSEATKGMIQTIMDRADAELLVYRLWDEKRLAYDIDKHKRAAYILCYFRANGSAVSRIERDVQLSEHLLRVLVLRADHVSPEEIERIKGLPDHRTAASAGPPAQRPPAKKVTDSRTQTEKPDTPAEVDTPEPPSEQPATEDTRTEDAATEDAPTKDIPTEDAPADEATTERPPTEDAPDQQDAPPGDLEKGPAEPTV